MLKTRWKRVIERESQEGKNLKFVLYGLLSVGDVLCPCLIKSCQCQRQRQWQWQWQWQRKWQRECDGRMRRMKKKRMMRRHLKEWTVTVSCVVSAL